MATAKKDPLILPSYGALLTLMGINQETPIRAVVFPHETALPDAMVLEALCFGMKPEDVARLHPDNRSKFDFPYRITICLGGMRREEGSFKVVSALAPHEQEIHPFGVFLGEDGHIVTVHYKREKTPLSTCCIADDRDAASFFAHTRHEVTSAQVLSEVFKGTSFSRPVAVAACAMFRAFFAPMPDYCRITGGLLSGETRFGEEAKMPAPPDFRATLQTFMTAIMPKKRF